MKMLIADDHLVVRRGLMQMIADEFEDVEITDVSDGKQAYDKLSRNHYDIAILDITMPEMSGLDVVRQLKKDGSKIPLLVLTTHPEDQYAIRLLKAGASGFLSKESAGNELIQAIQKILSGKKYITESLAEILAGDLSEDHSKPPHELLSDREFEVFKLLASGKRVSEIAEKLFLSIPTVSTYRRRLLEKMKLRNNAEAMHYAVQHKIV